MLRADFIMDETYCVRDIKKLNSPITALGGTNDKEADKQAILKWRDYAENQFNVFFLTEDISLLEIRSRRY